MNVEVFYDFIRICLRTHTCTEFGFAEFVSKLLSSKKKINELIKKKKLCVNMFILWIKGKKKVVLFSFLRVYFAEVGSMSMVIKCNLVDTMFSFKEPIEVTSYSFLA